jgi:hypothetical protein
MVALLLKLVLSPVVRARSLLCASPNGPALRWS